MTMMCGIEDAVTLAVMDRDGKIIPATNGETIQIQTIDRITPPGSVWADDD
jgi:hypothetical protein